MSCISWMKHFKTQVYNVLFLEIIWMTSFSKCTLWTICESISNILIVFFYTFQYVSVKNSFKSRAGFFGLWISKAEWTLKTVHSAFDFTTFGLVLRSIVNSYKRHFQNWNTIKSSLTSAGSIPIWHTFIIISKPVGHCILSNSDSN